MDSNVLQYLKDNLYLIQHDSSWIISNKFIRDVGATTPTQLPKPATAEVKSGNSLTKEGYKQFIDDAGVPSKINAGNGSFFWANRYSNDGFNAWKKALNSVEYKVLLAATKYYYKQSNTARVMVGNFFSQGIYESFVDDVKNALENKKVLVVEDSSSNMEQG